MGALVEGSVNDWAGRSGKLLLFFAGLAALIDVIGPERFGRWADNAVTRRDLVREQLQALKLGRPLLRLGVTMIHRVVASRNRRTGSFSSPWFTAEEFDRFATRTREKLEDRGITISLNQAAKIVIYDEAYEFLAPRLSPEQQKAFRRSGSTFRTAERTWRLGMRVIMCAVAVLFLLSFIFPIFVLLAIPFVAAITLLFDFVSAPFLKIVLWAIEFRLMVTRVPLIFIGPKKDGWRLRVVALIAFVVGSLLDLVVSW